MIIEKLHSAQSLSLDLIQVLRPKIFRIHQMPIDQGYPVTGPC